MKTGIRMMLVLGCFAVGLATFGGGCGGGACGDLDKKKSECSKDGPNKDTCEKAVEAAVKAGNQDACKAMLDNMEKKK
ncbi:MAG: hypothetical protein U0271_40430 [Polyangiaceae bacterium]